MTNSTLNYVTTNSEKDCRKIFAIAIVILGIHFAIFTVLFFGGYSDTHYKSHASVYTVDEDYTMFIDGAGYLWEVKDTNYHKGQSVEIKFFNNCTDYTREDDIILNVKLLDE